MIKRQKVLRQQRCRIYNLRVPFGGIKNSGLAESYLDTAYLNLSILAQLDFMIN
jgi:hypothetical protein